MFYLNQLIRYHLAKLSTHPSKSLNTEQLAYWASQHKLFSPHHFFAESVAAEQLRNRLLECDMEEYIPLMPRNQVCREYVGICQQKGNIVEVITKDGAIHHLSINDQTQFQKKYLNGKFHIYATESKACTPVAQVIVTAELNSLFSSFEATSVRCEAIQELFSLSAAEQHILLRFLHNQKYAKATLLAIAQLALKSKAEKVDMQDEYNLRSTLEHYTETYDNCLNVDDLLLFLDIQNVKEILYYFEDEMCGGDHWESPWLTYLTLFKLLNDGIISKSNLVFILKHFSPQEIASAIERFCRKEIGVIIEKMLLLGNGLSDKINDILFELLFKDIILDAKHLHSIVDRLFSNLPKMEYLQATEKLLKTPYGGLISDYVSSSFQQSLSSGKPAFVYIQAAIWAYKKAADSNPIDEALVMIRSPLEEERLIAMGLFTLLLDTHRNSPNLFLKEFKLPKDFTAIEQVLFECLSSPSSNYPYAVSLFQSAFFSEYISNRILVADTVISGCNQALQELSLRNGGGKILALLPKPTEQIRMSPHDKQRYVSRFESALKNQEPMAILFGFRLCKNAGCWDKDSLIKQFRKLVVVLEPFEEAFTPKWFLHQLTHDFYTLFRITVAELLEYTAPDLTETSSRSIELLLTPLEEKDISYYRETARLSESVPLRTEEEIMRIIKFIQYTEYQSVSEDQEIAKSLVERSCIENVSMGSFLILNWFGILCRFDLGQRSLEFYLSNADILDRPTSFFVENRENMFGPQDITAFARFFESSPRVLSTLSFASQCGSSDVLNAFREAGKEGRLKHRIAYKINCLRAQSKPDFYRQTRICGRINSSFPQVASIEYFYDDLGVATAVAKTAGMKELYAFGYRSDNQLNSRNT